MRGVFSCSALALVAVSAAQTGQLRVEVGSMTRQSALARADAAVRFFAERTAGLTAQNRKRFWRGDAPFSLPTRVVLTRNGEPIHSGGTGKRFGDITLQVDGSFPVAYRELLEDVYRRAKPTMDALFGRALQGGTVRVANFDADIGDRQAVAGGYYVPDNGNGERQIRFPIYNSREAAAVNFIHAVLLAYQGQTPYRFDAYQEGLVRAVAARVARTSDVLDSFSAPLVEQVLFNSYEVGGYYDWYNQRALGGSRFIAPNLLKPPLPTGGSYGGLYLLRYRMSGAAWGKVLAEYPDFARGLNARLADDASIAGDPAKLDAAAQAVIQAARPTSPTVEGLNWPLWRRLQWILDVKDANGPKLLVQPTPIFSGLSGSDFGVFALEANWFSRTADGSEQLLGGTSYPIFWTPDLSGRFSTSAQDDRIDLAGAYGSIGPNFPNLYGGQSYRVPVDVPVQDQMQRVYLPAGAIARADGKESTFFGTLTGFSSPTAVRVYFGDTLLTSATPTRGAFGVRIQDNAFLRTAALRIEVQDAGGVWTRRVNKGPGELALDLRKDDVVTRTVGFLSGLRALGFSFDPYESEPSQVLGANPLVARYDAARARYLIYPDVEPFKIGNGYFTRLDARADRTFLGRRALEAWSVALKPGWNLISVPIEAQIPSSGIRVVRATDNPVAYDAALGTVLGAEAFRFAPGPNDPVSGLPETGSFETVGEFVPGQAVFVRCLAAEGATLIFSPDLRNRAVAVTVPRWLLRAMAQQGDVAVQAQAGVGSDKLKSELPPAVAGGLRASFSGMYRDVRVSGGQTYRLVLSGLRPGKIAYLRLDQLIGWAPGATFVDAARGRTMALSRYGARYQFSARAETETFEIRVREIR